MTCSAVTLRATSIMGSSSSAALAGPVAPGERGDQGERGMDARQRVTRAAGCHGGTVGVAGQPGHARELLHGGGEADPVPPRAAEPERRHAHHHGPRVHLVQHVVAEAERLHDPGREVLDDGVGAGDQALGEVDALGPTQVERDRPLAHVHAVEQPAVLPPALGARGGTGGEADAVGPLDRLDLHHVGPQGSEEVGGRGAGPEGGEVDDPDPVERQGRRVGRWTDAITGRRGGGRAGLSARRPDRGPEV